MVLCAAYHCFVYTLFLTRLPVLKQSCRLLWEQCSVSVDDGSCDGSGGEGAVLYADSSPSHHHCVLHLPPHLTGVGWS